MSSRFLLGGAILSTAFLFSCVKDGESWDQKQFNKEQKAITHYLDDQGIDYEEDVNSNLKYFIEGTGNDTLVQVDDYVKVSYTGYILGEETPYIAKTDTIVNLTQQIPGWWTLLPKAEAHETITMFIPSYFGYGTSGTTNVPASSTLLHRVEVKQAFDGFEYQQGLIDAYVLAHNLEAEIDSAQDLRYITLKQGVGNRPTKTSTVIVNYSGKLMNGTEFSSGSNVTLSLPDLITGWGILLPYAKEGGKIRMFIPAKYGFGTNYQTGIPPNSIVIFDVELISVL